MSEEYKPELNNEEEQPPKQKRTLSFILLRGKPIVTFTLIGITVLVYLLQALTKAKYGVDIPKSYGAKVSPYITYYHEYWRLITPVFLHGSILHILCNMYALFTLGPALEYYYGHWDFLRLYLISGFAGNVLSHIASPRTISVGASTALFGLIAAEAMFLWKNRHMIMNYKHALRNIGFILIINLMLGLSGGIDNWGHLGGLFGGLLLSYLIGPEFIYVYDEAEDRAVKVNTIPRSRIEISCLLTTLFLAALAYAL